MSLKEIFNGVPKISDKWEPYFKIYERHVGAALTELNYQRYTDDVERQIPWPPLVLVEVGVQNGGSLDMWSQYLDDQEINDYAIHGIDIEPACAELKYSNTNINVHIGDQGKPEFWDDFLTKVPRIDIFIDDGGHYMDQQILTFEKVFPKLSVGGVYICEDCHTSYMAGNGGGLNRKGTFIEYAKGYVDVLHYEWKQEMTSDLELKYKVGKDLSGLFFYDSVVVFEKHEKGIMKRVFPKRYTID